MSVLGRRALLSGLAAAPVALRALAESAKLGQMVPGGSGILGRNEPATALGGSASQKFLDFTNWLKANGHVEDWF